MRLRTGLVLGLIFTLIASGCASKPAAPKNARSAADPWEPMNRQLDGFNQGLDKISLKPVAKGYQKIVPQFMRTGIGNFSANLRTPLHIIASLLQGKGRVALSETGRFVTNSTIGLLGIMDPATRMGLDVHQEDFDQTFALWGVPSGPYVVLPLLGPQTVRSVFAIPLNLLADPLFWYKNTSIRDKIYILRLIDVRQRLFTAEKLLVGSQDRYLSVREAYLQNREYLIYDGDPPVDEDFYDEFLDEDEEDY